MVPSRSGPRWREGRNRVQVIRGALRVRGGSEYRLIVVLEDGQPIGDVRSVFLSRVRSESKIGAEKGGSELGYQFFHGVSVGTEAQGLTLRT